MQQLGLHVATSLIELSTLSASILAGCASGAVTGGLVSLVSNRKNKRQIDERLMDMMSDAPWVDYDAYSDFDSAEVVESIVLEDDGTSPEPGEEDAARDVEMPDEAAQGMGKSEPEPVPSEASRDGELDFGKGVPVIVRGVARDEGGAWQDAFTRGDLIDRRVPSFDEDESAEDGMVAIAQLQAPAEKPAKTSEPVEKGQPVDFGESREPIGPSELGSPHEFDVEEYVNQIVEEEMAINRSGSARRFSRSQLTMFEGTGDLSAARRAQLKPPRHMRPVAKEA